MNDPEAPVPSEGPPPIPPEIRVAVDRPRFANIGAIAVGAAVDIASTTALTTVVTMILGMRLGLAGNTSPETLQAALVQRTSSLRWLVSMGSVGLLFTIIGGYVAGRIAGFRHLRHGILTACVSGTVGLLLTLLGGSHTPAWFQVSGWIAALPAGACGGWLSRTSAAGSGIRRELR